MNQHSVPPWGGDDLVELLTLEALSETQFRNRCADRNAHDRTYGGQLLAQAVMAASRTVPAGRAPTAMQFLFLQGAQHRDALHFDVTPLQDGKRFSSRHVRGTQGGGRMVFDAQLSFAVPLAAPSHAAPPEPLRRFWLKTRQRLPDDAMLQAGAFAYLSDWWFNFAALGGHLPHLGPDDALYVASLNHAIWWHRPFRADEWLHFDCRSPAAGEGRGLTVARVHDRSGQLVASATQECLMAPRGAT